MTNTVLAVGGLFIVFLVFDLIMDASVWVGKRIRKHWNG